jgi:endo-1,4-beta-xylanase
MIRKLNFTLLSTLLILCSSSMFSADIDDKISALLAAEREGLPNPGELLYDITDMSVYNFNSSNGASMTVADADAELDFGRKFMIDVKMAGTNAWEPQFQTPINQVAVNNGDVVLYIFSIRKTEPAQNGETGQAAFFSQRSSSPWTGLGSLSLTLSDNWRRYYVIAKATEDFAIGEMAGTFHLGFMKQKVEIGGIIALNMGSDVNVDDLPRNELFYIGMEEDAEWRLAAAERIEEHRKSDISIEVLDEAGNPVEGATVNIEMQKHLFGFGSFISDYLISNSAAGDLYRENFLDLFNCGTTPFYMGGNNNDWGWYGTSGISKIKYPRFAKWFQDNNIPAKGHVLIWPGWNYMPSFFEDLAGDPEGLKQALYDHLDELVPIGKQYGLYEWDVVNEPFINHDVMDILGEDILVDWYKYVHGLDPNPKLILNEYNIIQGGGRKDFQDNFIRIVEFMKSEGAPLGGIGMQCHFDENLTSIPLVLGILDQFGELGLPIQITEFDINTRDEEMQAAYTRDFYTAVFSHPSAEKIVMWGFFEPVMWKPDGAFIRSDWSFKPNYHAYKDLLFNEWWTDENGVTDSDGKYAVRGFKGSYTVNISTPDTSYVIDFTMSGDADISIKGSEIDKDIVGFDQILEKQSLSLISFPNPFSDETKLEYSIKESAFVNIRIFDSKGSLIRSISHKQQIPGTHHVVLGGDELDPGMYLCVVDTGNQAMEKKTLVLIKEN